VVSLCFLFSSARDSDCFVLLVLAHKNTCCCVCAEAILAASLNAARSLWFLSPPMAHGTAQQQHAFVCPCTQSRPINVLVSRRLHDHKIALRWLRRFAGGVSLQDKVGTGDRWVTMDFGVAYLPSFGVGRTGAIDPSFHCDATCPVAVESHEHSVACSQIYWS
jgi:hypothetical protein